MINRTTKTDISDFWALGQCLLLNEEGGFGLYPIELPLELDSCRNVDERTFPIAFVTISIGDQEGRKATKVIDPLQLVQHRAALLDVCFLTSDMLSDKEPTVSFENPSVAYRGERQHV